MRTSVQSLQSLFDLEEPFEWEARYNIAPTDTVPIVACDKEGRRRLKMAKWGLVPSWAKDTSIGIKMLNARAETLTERPAYRRAFERRRCLVPADGFFEWTDAPEAAGKRAPKQPYRFTLDPEAPFAFAGLYEINGSGEHALLSFTIVTTTPNELVTPFHDRMPVILPPEQYAVWLDREVSEPEALQPLLRPLPAETMRAYPVTTKINRPAYDEPDGIEPVALAS